MTLASEGLTDGVQASPAAHAVDLRKTYGTGQAAVPNDPTGIVDPTGFRAVGVKELFLYVFLASTFRY